jgi:uncharacterized protein
MPMSEQQFVEHVRKNPVNRRLLDSLPSLELPQGTLTAGCLAQTVWNVKAGHAPDRAIKDYDLFYFDADDLSWQAEDAVIQSARKRLGDLAETVEIRNQARVHLWYPQKFGAACPPLTRVEDGIDCFLITSTQVGIRVENGSVYAPHGFSDLWNGILRINPYNPLKDLFISKCADYRARWPWLSVAI